MTDTDNKDPQITADYKVPEGYTLVLSWLYENYKSKAQLADQLSTELKQLRAENSNLREALAFGIKNPEIVRVIKSKLTDSAQSGEG